MKYFAIEKKVSLENYKVEIKPADVKGATFLDRDSWRLHFNNTVGALIRSDGYKEIKIKDGWSYLSMELMLPIEKDPFLLDKLVKEAFTQAEALIKEAEADIKRDKEEERKKQQKLQKLQEEEDVKKWLNTPIVH